MVGGGIMKKALLKDSLKEIKTSYKRFISILLMALLGVGFFAGLRATSPDMIDTLDKYYKDQNVYDIEILSTLGLTDEDIEELEKIENVEKVYGSYSEDALVNTNNKELVAKILIADEVNKPKVVEGSLPVNKNECAVEANFLKSVNKNIGDTIQIEKNEDNEILDVLELKITGIVESPLYISRDRGTSKLGSGTINSYIYVNKENVKSDVFTEIYITLKDSKKYETSSKKYEEYVESTKDKIEEIKETREKARYDELIENANEEIKKAEDEFNTKKADGENQIKEAENKINSGKVELEKAENELKANEVKANTEFNNAENKLASAKKELEENENKLIKEKEVVESKLLEASKTKEELKVQLNTLNESIGKVELAYKEILNNLQNPELTEEEKKVLNAQRQEIEKQKKTLEETKKKVSARNK